MPLTIDDRLPCDKEGSPIHARSGVAGELWVPLVEKAFAKLLGGYDALRMGYLPHALRALTGGVPLTLTARGDAAPADGGDANPLTWERLRELHAAGAPVALLRSQRAEEFLASGGSTGGDLEVSGESYGGLLHGLAYPVVRTREGKQKGSPKEILLSSPFAPWDEHAAGKSAGSKAVVEDSERGRWIPFDIAVQMCDVAHAAQGGLGGGGDVSAELLAELGGFSGPREELPGGGGVGASTLRLQSSEEWPPLNPPRGSSTLLAGDQPTPAYLLSVRRPLSSALLLLEQLLPPRATPPQRCGIGLLIVSLDTAAAERLAEGVPSGGWASGKFGVQLVAHTLPVRPNRRVVLDLRSPLGAGEYLILPLRLSTAPVKPVGFRLEMECAGGGTSSRANRSQRPNVTLLPIPNGLPKGGSELLSEVSSGESEVAQLLQSIGPTTEGLSDGRHVRAQLVIASMMPLKAKAVRKLQQVIRGRHQRRDLEELRALQLAREMEEGDAIAVMQAGIRGRMGRKRAGGVRKEVDERTRAAAEKARADLFGEAAMTMTKYARGYQARKQAKGLKAGLLIAAADMQNEALMEMVEVARADGEFGEGGTPRASYDHPYGLKHRLEKVERQLLEEIKSLISSGSDLRELNQREGLLQSVRRFLKGEEGVGVPSEEAERMRLMEELRLQGYKEEEAARILQAGYRGYGARQLVGEMRYDRALLTIQAGARVVRPGASYRRIAGSVSSSACVFRATLSSRSSGSTTIASSS